MKHAVIGIDPGAVTGIALLLAYDYNKVSLVRHKIMTFDGILKDWINAAAAVAARVFITAEGARAEFGVPPFICIEYPVIGPSHAVFACQQGMCAAIEADLTNRGWPIYLRVNPQQSKSNLGVKPVRGKVNTAGKKEPMVLAIKGRGLWPSPGPKLRGERYALADAIAHALVGVSRLPMV